MRLSVQQHVAPSPRDPPKGPAPPPERGLTIAEYLAQITPHAWVTPALVALIVLGFGVEVLLGASPLTPTSDALLGAGADYGPLVADGQWWRLVSSMFLHVGLLHIAFNLWAFWNGGKFAERVFGNVPFLVIYLLSGVGGSLASLAMHPMTVAVGASGAIFGVYGATLAFVLLHRGVFPPAFLAQQRKSLLSFIGYNVIFGLSQKNIDMAAHAGGLITGMVAGALMNRDLLQPTKHAGRRALGAVALAAALLLAARGLQRRLAASPEVMGERAATAALARLQAEQYPEAIDLYTEALAYRRDAHWLSNRGLAHMLKDEYALAKKDFLDSFSLDPALRTRARLCDVDVRLSSTPDEREAAVKYCSDVIALDPKNATLLTIRAAARSDQDRLADALADANAALALDESNEVARLVRADVRLRQGNADEAETDCAVLVAQKPPRPIDLVTCARVAFARSDAATERARLDQCLTLAPSDADALRSRGLLNEREGRLADSATDFTALVAVTPNESDGWNDLAWIEVLREDFAAARPHADKAIGLAPGAGSHYGTRCFALAGLGLEGEARADCARAVELAPDSMIDRGMLAFLDKRYADARRAWQVASQNPLRTSELQPWLARLPP